MQEIIAPVQNIKFDIETAIEEQMGAIPLPFPGMDKSGAAICKFYLTSTCTMGETCPFRHNRDDHTVVCKHWLRGLCKKGDKCDFLHKYDESKLPECYFFTEYGKCNNKVCTFLHIDAESRVKECPWYNRGFCRLGPQCKNRHVRRVICQSYINGFCLYGSHCIYEHPRFDIPPKESHLKGWNKPILCYTCGQPGHKAASCPASAGYPSNHNAQLQPFNEQLEPTDTRNWKPLSQIVCFKCRERGHNARRCPKRKLKLNSNTMPDNSLEPPYMDSNMASFN